MSHGSDAPIRYFSRVYPLLRGARGGQRVTGGLTEPGRDDRLAWVLAEMNGVERSPVLDAGCGVGSYAVELALLGHHVTAVDVSQAMLTATRRAALAAGVSERIELVHQDLRTWRPKRAFATVLSLGVAEYYPDALELLERQYSWADQRLLVTWSAAGVGPRSVLRKAWLGMHGLHVRLLEAPELTGMLSRFPDCEVRPQRTRWTHCAVVRRTRRVSSGRTTTRESRHGADSGTRSTIEKARSE
jgi:SAM-dependent methyltransferase